MIQLASPTSPTPPGSISSPNSTGGGGLVAPGGRVTSSDACLSIVHALMQYRTEGESESFSKRAIESLVKKLKEKREELDALIQGVTSAGALPTCCITIPRTLDGRLQVAGRKGFPHVVYAKIWRWPDLHKNELRHVRHCRYAFDLKESSVCVNPYHYERVVGAPMDISDSPPPPPPPPLVRQHHQQQQQHQPPSLPLPPPPPPPPLQSANAAAATATIALPPISTALLPPRQQQQQHHHQQQQQQQHMWNAPASHPMLPPSPWLDPPIASCLDSSVGHYGGAIRRSSVPASPAPPYSTSSTSSVTGMAAAAATSAVVNPVHWCSISYYELAEQIGETFKVPYHQSEVTIDGYTNPSSPHRFCLGQLSNVQRTDASERARLHIGRGVSLSFQDGGDVWLNCLSDHPVFVESLFLNRESGRPPGERVHKFYPSHKQKVFDINFCHQEMRQQAAAAVTASAGNENESAAESIGVGVDDLRRLCVLRISFVKGWGSDYRRRTIKETPCWVEIQLHKPLQLLDEVLQCYQNGRV